MNSEWHAGAFERFLGSFEFGGTLTLPNCNYSDIFGGSCFR